MKKTWARVLANFIIVNICGLFPILWVGFGWMPDQVKIYMRGTEELPGAIVTDGTALLAEDYGLWANGRLFRFYMRGWMDWKGLSFRFPGKTGTQSVDRIVLEKWKLVALGKAGSELKKKEGTADEYIFDNPRFDTVGLARGKVTWTLGVVELMLLGMSWVAARRHPEAWKSLWPSVVCMALVATTLMEVVLPIQSYLANRIDYPFSPNSLVAPISVRFVLAGMLSIVSIGLLTRCFGRWILGVVFAFSICVYLESGILSNGLASLNGDILFLLNRTRMLWDALVWCGVFVLVMGLHSFLRSRYVMASLCLAVMVAASMLDTRREKVADKSQLIVEGFVPCDTVIQNVVYSTNHNVMVFILDSLEREQAHAIMNDSEAGAQLRNSFRGFTEYTNNVGALPNTVLAVPNMLTGHYPDGLEDMVDYVWSCYGENSALRNQLEAGHDVFITTPALHCGYASRRDETRESGKPTMSSLDITGNGGTTWSIRDFSRWRWMPFCTKASCAGLTMIASGSGEQRECGIYPILSQGKIDSTSSGTFLFVHTDGIHYPISQNRHGEMLATSDDSDHAAIELGIFLMNTLADLMEKYREMGIYDQSTILVLGDHGNHGREQNFRDRQEGRIPRNGRPCLWVKPAWSDHEFATSSLPTSHAKLADFFKRLAKGPLSEDETNEVLLSDKRVFRLIGLWGASWTDWVVDANGTFTKLDQQRSLDSETLKRPLKCGRHYPLQMRDATVKIDADFSFMTDEGGGGPILWRHSQRLTIDLLVPDASKKYALHLWLFDSKGGIIRFRDGATEAAGIEVSVEPSKEIVVRGLTASPSGVARVICERVSGPNVDVAFNTLMLEEDK